MPRAQTHCHVWILAVHLYVWPAQGFVHHPEISDISVHKPADINILFITQLTEYSQDVPCSSDLRQSSTPLLAQYITDKVNKNPHLLPNVSLGYFILDSCGQKSSVMTTKLIRYLNYDCNCIAEDSRFRLHAAHCYYSSVCTVVSPMLSSFRIPVISSMATSDVLSNKQMHPFFLRVVPPDNYQSLVMVDMLRMFNWTYFSVFHQRDAYGIRGAHWIRTYAKGYGLCIAFVGDSSRDTSKEEFDYLARQYVKHRKARVILVFSLRTETQNFMEALYRHSPDEKFIFIVSEAADLDVLLENTGLPPSFLVNSFAITLDQAIDPAMNGYLESTNLDSIRENELYTTLLKMRQSCLGNNTFCNYTKTLGDLGYRVGSWSSLLDDSVQALARGLHAYLEKACPEVFGGNKQLLHSCYNGTAWLESTKSVEFKTVRGTLKFDSKGDYMARYYVKQLQWLDNESVSKSLQVMLWENKAEHQFTSLVTAIKWSDFIGEKATPSSVPEVVCSKPCKLGEFRIQQDPKCCWECKKCRVNEHLVENGTRCIDCPLFSWPDEVERLFCRQIPPTYMKWSDPTGMSLAILAGIGVVTTTGVVVFLTYYHQDRLVRASSRKICYMILIGSLTGFGTVFTIVAKPTNTSCLLIYLGLSLSCAIAYSAMLVKTVRIYRLFSASDKLQKEVRFLSNKTQLIFSVLVTKMQIAVCTMSLLLAGKVVARKSMPIFTEKYVEVMCFLPSSSFIPPLALNLVLLLLLTVFGFKTRKLSENYNESWFIFLIATITCFMWSAFIPTFFVVRSGYSSAVLLSVASLFSSAVVVICLFGPKIYAVWFLDESMLNLVKTGNPVMTTMPSHIGSNRSVTRESVIQATAALPKISVVARQDSQQRLRVDDGAVHRASSQQPAEVAKGGEWNTASMKNSLGRSTTIGHVEAGEDPDMRSKSRTFLRRIEILDHLQKSSEQDACTHGPAGPTKLNDGLDGM